MTAVWFYIIASIVCASLFLLSLADTTDEVGDPFFDFIKQWWIRYRTYRQSGSTRHDGSQEPVDKSWIPPAVANRMKEMGHEVSELAEVLRNFSSSGSSLEA